MEQYVVITRIDKELEENEWWNTSINEKTVVKTFSSFEEAKKAMREEIKNVTASCDFFPIENKKYAPISEYIKDVKEYFTEEDEEAFGILSDIVENVVSNPNYEYQNDFDFVDADDGDWMFAFAGNSNRVVILYYGKELRFNVHNMKNSSKNYYFTFEDEDKGASMSIEMFKAE